MRFSFYADRKDLIQVITSIESMHKLSYVKSGFVPSKDAAIFSSLITADLGIAPFGTDVLNPNYIVVKDGIDITTRAVRGGAQYEVSLLTNPKAINFYPGGNFGNDYIIYGEVITNGTEPEAVELFKIFSSTMKKQFTRIGGFYIGKFAEGLMDRGGRLTQSIDSPKECDIRREG